ncbi:glycosyltransferase [Balneolaceae bacterium ANBcel3]|nr:glycosyltransferase [Balneolaceae bacterium ANBcel3]
MISSGKKDLILLTNAFPYSNAEVFLEKELPFLPDAFNRVFLLPLFPEGTPRRYDERIILLSSSPPSLFPLFEFLRGIFCSTTFFFEEWKRSPGYPLSLRKLYLIARTAGIAKRIEHRIEQAASTYGIKNALIYSYWMNQGCIGGIFAAKRHGWKVVSRTHGGDLYTERYPGNYLPWHQWKVQNLDAIMPVSRNGAMYLKNRYPGIQKKIFHQRLGVADLKPVSHTPGSGNSLHIASCSSVIPLKRVNLILETVLSLKKILPEHNVRWTHFGNGPLLKEIEAKAKAAHTDGLDIHLTGHIDNSKIPAYYHSEKVDLFINYSTTEGIPVSIMEAFSCGIPAAAPDVGGISELVSSENGLLFDHEDTPEVVAHQIFTLFIEGGLSERGKQARNMWARDYDLSQNFTSFALFLASI